MDAPVARRWLPLRLAVVAVVVVLAVVVALLAGRPETLVLATYRGVPGGVTPGADQQPGWVLGDDGRLAVYAAGSSSCPWLPTQVGADGDHVVVQLGRDGAGPCTDDLVFTTSVVAVPDGVNPGRMTVEIRSVEPAED